MLFNSYEFILVFLPLVFVMYFLLTSRGLVLAAKILLLSASWFFYAWWNPAYLPLLLGSIAGNFLFARLIERYAEAGDAASATKKRLMIAAVVANVGLLCFYKYMDFFIGNLNYLGADIPLLKLALPLAISFFTLQQIAFIVDTYRGVARERNFLDYCIFVSFFPQLIAGPIVHHKELMPQLRASDNKRINYSNVSSGLFLFSIGLFKKVVLADTFANWATNGFDYAQSLNVFEAWIVSYSYTLQLYFDFSAYSDMALGLALLFNIKLPVNFNSPYQATSIINLWQRWHITLTRFINKYIYKPMLKALPRVNFKYGMLSSFTAMFIAGVWHGAAWTFVVFGVLQGVAIVINHCWRKLNFKMPAWLGWLLTFHFFSFSLVIFRALDWESVQKVYGGMLGFGGIGGWLEQDKIYASQAFWYFSYWGDAVLRNVVASVTALGLCVAGLAIVVLLPNSNQWADRFSLKHRYLAATVCFLLIPLMLLSRPSEFIYFQF